MIELNEYDDTGLVHSTNKLHIKRSLRFSYLLRERTLPAVDVCLVMTKGLLTYYQQYLTKPGVQIALIPMTVDLCRFKGIKDIYEFKKPYIAYCGSSSFSKDGVDVLIKSFSKIALLYTEIKLYIAAFWEIDGNKMIKLISETNMEDRIIYLGTLNRDEIPGFVNNASLLTLPRPPSKQARGGFPTKLGEYLATGNPVCATKVGEIPDYLTDNQSAFLAEPGNIESFSDAMIRALSNSELAKQVGMNGRKVAEKHFSMEIQAERVFSILSENIKYQ
jgi:glycosyltransferase involved in cell wall biosynthesis